MGAIDTELSFVKRTCPPLVYRTMWDLLCNQLYTQVVPPALDTEDAFDEVKIWSEGEITMTKTDSPYTFTIEIDTDTPPKASDIILFGNRFYIIGEVEDGTEEDTYICSGCIAIDVSIVGVYAALLYLNEQMAGAPAAEAGRVLAEEGRVEAEASRQAAESERDAAYTQAESDRDAAYVVAEGARNDAFEDAEATREAYLRSLLTPWVVPGAVIVANNHFVADDESQTPQDGYTKWHGGYRVHLVDRNGRTEEVIADDGEYLITLSGWKWKYTEDE